MIIVIVMSAHTLRADMMDTVTVVSPLGELLANISSNELIEVASLRLQDKKIGKLKSKNATLYKQTEP